ncbi:hypothetical protein EDB19DRAFT_1704752 [Suillus lakei]|nr:hypothetical protein EDB19DRAFT_1704752 [Suillus lakei]
MWLIDIFGTVLHCHSVVPRQVAHLRKGLLEGSQDAVDIAEEWRAEYYARTLLLDPWLLESRHAHSHNKRVVQGGEGDFNADIIY